jgi:hypothetical protein
MVTHAQRPQGAVRNCRRLGGSPAFHPRGVEGLSQDAGIPAFLDPERVLRLGERARYTQGR